MNAILAFLGIAPEIIGVAIDPLRRAYEKLLAILLIALGVLVFAFVANVFGHKEINIGLASVFALLTAIMWWRPQQVTWVATVGGIIGKLGEKNDISDGIKWFLTEYYKIFKTVLLVGTIVLFYLSFIPFRANPGAFFVLIAGSIVTSLLAERLEIVGKIGQKLGFYGACVIMGLAVVSLIPSGFWGTESSFTSIWIAEIKAKEGSIFVLALFLTVIFTLIDERGSAVSGKGRYTIIIFVLIGFMDIMFAPTAFDGAWGKYGWQGSAYGPPPPPKETATVPQVAQGPKKTVLSVMLTEPGVPMEIGNIPDFSKFEAGDFNCPSNTNMVVVHTWNPSGKSYDCDSATEEIKLGNDNRGLRIWFVLKQGAPPKEVTIVATAKS